jgi:hypothetical protein
MSVLDVNSRYAEQSSSFGKTERMCCGHFDKLKL